MRRIDLTNRKFGKLIVIKFAETRNKKAYWLCQCECGKTKSIEAYKLTSGETKSCGCLKGSIAIDLTGEVFGKLIVIERVENRGNQVRWLCRCSCGNTTKVNPAHLKSGHTKSCGCLVTESIVSRSITHGMSKSPEFKTWVGMKERCSNPNNHKYKDYGARGIRVCERWDSFENFYIDMGDKPSPKHSIDRVNVNGNYEPSNCRWATPLEQMSNQRRNRKVRQFTLKGEFVKEYSTISSAARSIGHKTGSNISSVCNGKRPHAGGYLWEYA